MTKRMKELMIEESDKKCALKEETQEKARKLVAQAICSQPPNKEAIDKAYNQFIIETINLGGAYGERLRIQGLKASD